MSSLIAYMDESGHAKHPQSRFVGMGGLVADCCSWKQLEVEWRAALEEAGINGAFHMRDFAHRRGEFKGWNEQRRQTLFGRLVKSIVDAAAVPVACVVSLDGFNAAPLFLRSFFKDPYHMCFQHVTKGAALQALSTTWPAEQETVAMVYAYQGEFGTTAAQSEDEQKGSAQKLWHAMKQSYWGQRMGTYESGSPNDLYPLQAADLFAYEITKEFDNLVNRPRDDMRYALRHILRPPTRYHRHHLIEYYDEIEMVRIFMEATGQDSRLDVQQLLTESWMRKLSVRQLLYQRIAALE
jgi:hypothetical protein